MSINSTRDTFFNKIYSLNKDNANIFIVAADLAGPSLDMFRKEFGDKFVNVGIAEQNLISVACGIALEGKRVIAYAANPFPIIRGFDHIRNAVALMKYPITIAGLGAGFGVNECGFTHYVTEDIALMRTLPTIKIVNVSDEAIALKAANETFNSLNPQYLRFDRLIENNRYEEDQIDFEKGFIALKQGEDVTILTYGYMLNRALEIALKLDQVGISTGVIDVYSIPFNEDKLIESIGPSKIVVIEEHSLKGGLSSEVLESFNDRKLLNQIKRFGIRNICDFTSEYGSRDYLLAKAGLGEEDIIKEIRENFNYN